MAKNSSINVDPDNLPLISNNMSDYNLTSVKDTLNIQTGISRSYSSIALNFDTSRTPNVSHDVLMIASIRLNTDDAETASVILQVDDGGGFDTIATIENNFDVSGVIGLLGTSDIVMTITAIIPANSAYKLVSSGTASNSIVSINELIL